MTASRERMSYPRCRQRAWAVRATVYEIAGTAAFIAAFIALGTGRALAAAVAFPAGCVLVAAYTGAADRAARNRIGADSEQLVRGTLNRLRPHGYTITHGVPWRAGGDIDHLVRTPDGLGLCIETKTRTFDHTHLERLRRQADSAARGRQFPRGVLPVLCVASEHDLQLLHDGIMIVSPDQILRAVTAAHAAA